MEMTSTLYFAIGPILQFLNIFFTLDHLPHQVGGGTLVVEPGEGRDPLTVNDQAASKLLSWDNFNML